MGYQIAYYGTSEPPKTIDKGTYRSLKSAMDQALAWLAIEIAYDDMICEYEEFHLVLIEEATNMMLRSSSFAWPSEIARRQRCLRRAQSFLTTAKRYIEVLQDRGSVFGAGKRGISIDVTRLLGEARTQSFSCRLMYVLRNVSEHAGLDPVQISPLMYYDESREAVEHTVHLPIDLEAFRCKKESETAVVAEMRDLPATERDFTSHAKHFVQALSEVHTEIRGLVFDRIKEQRGIVGQATTTSTGSRYPGAWPSRVDPVGTTTGEFCVFTSPFDYIDELMQRNLRKLRLSQSIVTSTSPEQLERSRIAQRASRKRS